MGAKHVAGWPVTREAANHRYSVMMASGFDRVRDLAHELPIAECQIHGVLQPVEQTSALVAI